MIPNIYRVEYVGRARYVVVATIVIAVLACAYTLATTTVAAGNLRRAENTLSEMRAERSRLAADTRSEQYRTLRLASGSVEALAVRFSTLASAGNLRIESLTPQAGTSPVNISFDGKSLGKWKPIRIKLRGTGDFRGVMAMIGKFRGSRVPASLNSVSMQNLGDDGAVTFELLLTTYERVREKTE